MNTTFTTYFSPMGKGRGVTPGICGYLARGPSSGSVTFPSKHQTEFPFPLICCQFVICCIKKKNFSCLILETEKIPVMRGQWFIDGTWQPLEEEESNLIEQEHLNRFKGQQLQESFDMEVSKPVDGKEGKTV